MHRTGKVRYWNWWDRLLTQTVNQYAPASGVFGTSGVRLVSEGPDGTFTFVGIGGAATVDIPIPTAIAQRYRVTFDLTGVGVDLSIGANAGSSELLGLTVSVGSQRTYEFVATSPITYIRLGSNAIALAVVSGFTVMIV